MRSFHLFSSLFYFYFIPVYYSIFRGSKKWRVHGPGPKFDGLGPQMRFMDQRSIFCTLYVHTNPSRKRGFWKSKPIPKEFENRGFFVLVWAENISKTKLIENHIRGRYVRNFWVGRCRWDPGILLPFTRVNSSNNSYSRLAVFLREIKQSQ